jgi:hypothetical protein
MFLLMLIPALLRWRHEQECFASVLGWRLDRGGDEKKTDLIRGSI